MISTILRFYPLSYEKENVWKLTLWFAPVLVLFAQQPEMEFVKIAPGEFLMGCSPKDPPYLPDGTVSACPADAQPAHRVRITKAFEIGKYEVTQAQWEGVMGNDSSFFKGRRIIPWTR